MKRWRFSSSPQQTKSNLDFDLAFYKADLKGSHQWQEHRGEALTFSPLGAVASLTKRPAGEPCTCHHVRASAQLHRALDTVMSLSFTYTVPTPSPSGLLALPAARGRGKGLIPANGM